MLARVGTSAHSDAPHSDYTFSGFLSYKIHFLCAIRSDVGRVLPTPPHSPRALYGQGSSGSKGTTSQDSNTSFSSSLNVEPPANRRQSSVSEAETIKIVIHDVETDQSRTSECWQFALNIPLDQIQGICCK